nr:unnamed protein product [Spirometra erinaceieuropaei]
MNSVALSKPKLGDFRIVCSFTCYTLLSLPPSLSLAVTTILLGRMRARFTAQGVLPQSSSTTTPDPQCHAKPIRQGSIP